MNTARKISCEEFEIMERDGRQKYELINGIIMMSPSPTSEHQFLGTNMISELLVCLRDLHCHPTYELDIKIDEKNVLKPDVMVFCEDQKNTPKIVIEILSPSTRRYDLIMKPAKYLSVEGILEYWIVDPKEQTVIVYDFVNDTLLEYGMRDTITSKNIPEIAIKVEKIFTFKIKPFDQED